MEGKTGDPISAIKYTQQSTKKDDKELLMAKKLFNSSKKNTTRNHDKPPTKTKAVSSKNWIKLQKLYMAFPQYKQRGVSLKTDAEVKAEIQRINTLNTCKTQFQNVRSLYYGNAIPIVYSIASMFNPSMPINRTRFMETFREISNMDNHPINISLNEIAIEYGHFLDMGPIPNLVMSTISIVNLLAQTDAQNEHHTSEQQQEQRRAQDVYKDGKSMELDDDAAKNIFCE